MFSLAIQLHICIIFLCRSVIVRTMWEGSKIWAAMPSRRAMERQARQARKQSVSEQQPAPPDPADKNVPNNDNHEQAPATELDRGKTLQPAQANRIEVQEKVTIVCSQGYNFELVLSRCSVHHILAWLLHVEIASEARFCWKSRLSVDISTIRKGHLQHHNVWTFKSYSTSLTCVSDIADTVLTGR